MQDINEPDAERSPKDSPQKDPAYLTRLRVDLYTSIHKALRCAL